MTDDDALPEQAERAFQRHEAFEPADGGFSVTTTAFDAAVTVAETDDSTLRYTVTVRTPLLSTVAEEEVGHAVEAGWFETFECRLEDAAGVTRRDVELAEYALHREGGEAVATLIFEWADTDRAPDVAKSLVEYVEGTYVASIVSGYEYGEPVRGLLSQASHGGDGESGSDLGGVPPL